MQEKSEPQLRIIPLDRDCNGLKLHTNGVSASHKLVVKADRDEVMELPRLSFYSRLKTGVDKIGVLV